MPQWTRELERCLQETETIAHSLSTLNWFPIHCRNSSNGPGLWEIIERGEAMGIFKPGMDVLNLGSGSGVSSMVWAARGYHVVGIEIEAKIVTCARAQVQKYKRLFPQLPIFVQGSYFPVSYLGERRNLEQRNKKSPAMLIEARIQQIYPRETLQKFALVSDNALSQAKLDFRNFQIVYAYPHLIQAPSLVELFVCYAAPDALLCLTNPLAKEDYDLLEVRMCSSPFFLKKFQK